MDVHDSIRTSTPTVKFACTIDTISTYQLFLRKSYSFSGRSILGTWRGHPGEQWSSAQGLESVLLSVQSLMSANPYENEPGFENLSERYKEDAEHYIEKVGSFSTPLNEAPNANIIFGNT